MGPRIAVVLGSLLALAAPKGGGPAPVTLSRLRQIWVQPELGRFEGVSAGRVYYTVSNDGKSVQAIDVGEGRLVWRTPLAAAVPEFVRVLVHGDAVVLAYARGRSRDAVFTALAAKDGRLLWSQGVSCENPYPQAGGKKLFLVCQHEPHRAPSELREIDAATGRKVGSVNVDAAVRVAPGGEICGTTSDSFWCGRLERDRVDIAWKGPGALWMSSELVAGYVIQDVSQELTIRRVQDGRIAWKRKGLIQAGVQERSGRLILFDQNAVEVVGLADGKAVARFPFPARAATVHAEGDLVVIDPAFPGGNRILVIDAALHAREVAKNVMFLSRVVGDVLLSQNVGMSGANREVAPLEAYSLTRFAAAEEELDAYHRVVAVLERYPLSYQAQEALPELRKIPGATALLEEVLAKGPPGVASAAIAVAGLTGDARFVGVLRGRLDAITVVPVRVDEWVRALEVVESLSQLQSPDAGVALLAFWKRIGARFSPPWRREIVSDLVASAMWRFGARKELIRCEDTTFPVERADPEKASLGTASPGVAYASDGNRRWAAICEARQDNNGDGKVEVVIGRHGEPGGDVLRPYLVLGAGKGTEIDDFVAADPKGRWLVTTKDMCVHLVDAQSGRAVALRAADGRPGDVVMGSHRAASFSADGKTLLYLRSDGSHATVVQRDLGTGAERTIDPGPGELVRTFVDRSGRFVVMEVLSRDTDGDGLLTVPRVATTLSRRRCRGSSATYSTFGMIGDKPVQRVAPVAGGPVSDAPAGPPLEPSEEAPPHYQLVSGRFAERWRVEVLPVGPFRWGVVTGR